MLEQVKFMAHDACIHGPVDMSSFVRNLKTGLSVAKVNGDGLVHVSWPKRWARHCRKGHSSHITECWDLQH